MFKKFCLLFLLLLVPFYVKADSISLNCNSLVKGSTLTCQLSGNSSDVIIAISGKVKTGNNISFSSFTGNSIWQGNGEKGLIDLYTDSDISGNFSIGTVTFDVTKVKNGYDSYVSLDTVMFYDINGTEHTVSSISKNIRIAATDNNLKSLSLNNGNLNPVFNSSTTIYSTTINSSTVTINAVPFNNSAKVTGIGTKKLNYGNNTFKINVTSESGNTKTYSISINRPSTSTNSDEQNIKKTEKKDSNNEEKKSSNNYLKELSIKKYNLSPKFDKENLKYNVEVDEQIKKIDIITKPEDSKTKVKIIGNDNLKVGHNLIKIEVTSEDNKTRTYLITVDVGKDSTTDEIDKNDYTTLDENDTMFDNGDFQKEKFDDKKVKTIFIVIISILLLINAIRILINVFNKER